MSFIIILSASPLIIIYRLQSQYSFPHLDPLGHRAWPSTSFNLLPVNSQLHTPTPWDERERAATSSLLPQSPSGYLIIESDTSLLACSPPTIKPASRAYFPVRVSTALDLATYLISSPILPP
ncbi:hypothetical protein IE53DRAFT_13729 [Violaceomyces palustris]|uniref:Uncharacterized protein n=1 Tax=Violaceomyces palustris TaxID=1673888 RepID=A0ACD0P221_9BASI|nr:hypothetical protein IE53DRAFT_13729 [Violaceomyces palustris]